MLSIKTALLALAAATVVSADYYINPESVPLSTRKSWCSNELSTCPIICQQTPPGTTKDNTCDADTLTYGCVCGDGLQPNISEYSLTLPFFVCQEWGNQCVTGCGRDSACASSCRQDHPCGALDPKRDNATSTTASGTGSATASSTNLIYTGLGGEGSASTSNPKGNVATPVLDFGRGYSLLVVGGCLFAGFALML